MPVHARGDGIGQFQSLFAPPSAAWGIHTIEEKAAQNITVYDRSRAEITAVRDVDSISEFELTAHLDTCRIAVDGDGLKIEGFSTSDGRLTIVGRINGIMYFEDSEAKRSPFSRKARR